MEGVVASLQNLPNNLNRAGCAAFNGLGVTAPDSKVVGGCRLVSFLGGQVKYVNSQASKLAWTVSGYVSGYVPQNAKPYILRTITAAPVWVPALIIAGSIASSVYDLYKSNNPVVSDPQSGPEGRCAMAFRAANLIFQTTNKVLVYGIYAAAGIMLAHKIGAGAAAALTGTACGLDILSTLKQSRYGIAAAKTALCQARPSEKELSQQVTQEIYQQAIPDIHGNYADNTHKKWFHGIMSYEEARGRMIQALDSKKNKNLYMVYIPQEDPCQNGDPRCPNYMLLAFSHKHNCFHRVPIIADGTSGKGTQFYLPESVTGKRYVYNSVKNVVKNHRGITGKPLFLKGNMAARVPDERLVLNECVPNTGQTFV